MFFFLLLEMERKEKSPDGESKRPNGKSVPSAGNKTHNHSSAGHGAVKSCNRYHTLEN